MATRLFCISMSTSRTPAPQASPALPSALPPLSPLVEASHLTISRGQTALLKDINWTVRPGEHWAVLGGNGAGKSTLIKAALGLIWPDQAGGGRIVWNFGAGAEESPLAVRAASMLISPQTQAWYAHNAGELSGEELLLCGLYGTPRIYRAVEAQDRTQARNLARGFNLDHLLDLSLEAMSQGQLRRMLIASACLARPRILALDEAADGLDAAGRRDLFALLEQLAGQGLAMPSEVDSTPSPAPVTLFMAAHREEDLPGFITHVLHLDNGRVCAQRPAGEQTNLLPEPATPISIPKPPATAEATKTSAFKTKNSTRKTNSGSAAYLPPMLELLNVSVFLGRRPVLRNLNWRVAQGEHWAVTGPNGSGKTTLLRLIWGEIPAALGGELRWFGRSGPFNIPALRRRFGLVSDRVHQTMPPDLSAEDVVVSGFFGSIGLYEEPAPAMYAAVADIMQRLDLEHLSGRLFGDLSFGEARRLLLARALAHKPTLLLLDEALSGLDATSREAFRRDLSQAAREGTVQVIQISHHPDDFIAEIDNILYLDLVNKEPD